VRDLVDDPSDDSRTAVRWRRSPGRSARRRGASTRSGRTSPLRPEATTPPASGIARLCGRPEDVAGPLERPVRRSHRPHEGRRTMPTGRIRMFDAKRRFGFLVSEDGDEYYVPASASTGRARFGRRGRVRAGRDRGNRRAVATVTVVRAAPPGHRSVGRWPRRRPGTSSRSPSVSVAWHAAVAAEPAGPTGDPRALAGRVPRSSIRSSIRSIGSPTSPPRRPDPGSWSSGTTRST
jgi:cold shock CspA family protein